MESMPGSATSDRITTGATTKSCSSDTIGNDVPAEGVSKFVHSLGTSAGFLSLDENESDILKYLSPTLRNDKVVCCLPLFYDKEDFTEDINEINNVDKSQQNYILSNPLTALTCLRNNLENAILSLTSPPIDENIEIDSHVEEEPPKKKMEFTRASLSDAPMVILRNLQDAFRSLIRIRFYEWRALLERHSSPEAAKLVQLLKFQKMIVGIRGNTRFQVLGIMESSVNDEEKGLDTTLPINEEANAVEQQSLSCSLYHEVFVKIRRGSQTFSAQCYTLCFEEPGIIHYSLNSNDNKLTWISFDCNEESILHSMREKANALVLKAIASQAAESVRWSKTYLEKHIWNGDDSSSISSVSTVQSYSTMGTILSYISSLTLSSTSSSSMSTSNKTLQKSSRKKKLKFNVPKNIITDKMAEESSMEGPLELYGREERKLQNSTWYQILAFILLFILCLLMLQFKEAGKYRLDQFLRFSDPVTLYQRFKKVSHFSTSAPKGVSFHRIVNKFPKNGNATFELKLDEENIHCQSIDKFGVNDCHYDWGDHASGNYSVAMPQMLNESSRIQAKLLLEGHIPYDINCSLCGRPCEIEVPLIDFQYSFDMPDCPVDLRNRTAGFHYSLWKHSPTEGLVSISLDGTAVVYSSPDIVLAEFEVHGTIR